MQCDGGQASKERAFRKPLHRNALRFHDTAKLVETGHFCRPVDAGCCGSIFPPRTMMWPFARAACHPVVLSSRFFMHRDVYVAQLSALLEQRVDVVIGDLAPANLYRQRARGNRAVKAVKVRKQARLEQPTFLAVAAAETVRQA